MNGAIWKLVSLMMVAMTIGGSRCAGNERPPQFVLMAFDGCTRPDRWQDLTNFISEMKSKNISVQFTFFVSGVNFLAEQKKNLYKGPHHEFGRSNIDFGGSTDDVRQRITFINALHTTGSEIGSHAVGHFDGGEERWSADDWRNEFQSFRSLFLNVAANNELPANVKFNFAFDDIVGFRAPYLSTTPALYTVLHNNNFRYDTSDHNGPELWPKKTDGIWRFNLADLKIAGTGKKTVSMDYNFYVNQSNAQEDPNNRELYRQQMINTYVAYFIANYTGNRAPINIGHHFTPYQGGVYHQALQTFARLVCGLPEVKCVTYSRLADFMDGLSVETRAAYQSGDFPHAKAPDIEVTCRGTAQCP